MSSLAGKIAVVTGASRGGGKGIAMVLGGEGATVYVTGRSTSGAPHPKDFPGTIEATAEAVTRRGGTGIPVRCDHRDDDEVARLFDRVRTEKGRLDILVNNAYGGAELLDDLVIHRPFWQHSLGHWDTLFNGGLRNHLVASRLAVPLMLDQGRGLIVTTSFWQHDRYMVNLFYDLAMTAQNRLAFAMAEDLRPHGITSIALIPGFMRTEIVEATYDGDRSVLESVEYVGRAVARLAADPAVLDRSGRTLMVGDLAVEYGFTDIDGRVVPPYSDTTPE